MCEVKLLYFIKIVQIRYYIREEAIIIPSMFIIFVRKRGRDLFAFLAGKKNFVRVKNVWGEVTLLLRSYESVIIFERKRLLFDIIRCLQFS